MHPKHDFLAVGHSGAWGVAKRYCYRLKIKSESGFLHSNRQEWYWQTWISYLPQAPSFHCGIAAVEVYSTESNTNGCISHMGSPKAFLRFCGYFFKEFIAVEHHRPLPLRASSSLRCAWAVKPRCVAFIHISEVKIAFIITQEEIMW